MFCIFTREILKKLSLINKKSFNLFFGCPGPAIMIASFLSFIRSYIFSKKGSYV
jgi:hypothetical protein